MRDVLLDLAVPRTRDAIVERFTRSPPGGPVEAWLFEDGGARREAEKTLVAKGITARFRSAYKPLLHFFLEEVDLSEVVAATVHFPKHGNAHAERFLLETYPLTALFPAIALTFVEGGEGLDYRVEMRLRDGRTTSNIIFAPNRARTTVDGTVLACCGWLRAPGIDEALPTDFEAIFDAAVTTVADRFGAGPRPPFDRLKVRVELPARDLDLDYWKESISLREVMHEDVFFSIREALGGGNRAMNAARGAKPGQIVPDIRAMVDKPRLRMTIETFGDSSETVGATIPLATANRPLAIAEVRDELARIPGETFSAETREGREVRGVYRKGPGPAVLVTGAQHANETTGVVGALRAAQRLGEDASAHFAVIPVENVDGYELHQRLIVENPKHMHHAARYTATGDDLWYHPDTPLRDRTARLKALELSGAKLHLNLHGYPAHEWTRPMSGYLPRTFEMWTMPKGFFLVMRYAPGFETPAMELLERVTAPLARLTPGVVALNTRQTDVARAHSRSAPFKILNGYPYLFEEDKENATPLMLITEAPDETIYGDDFVMFQEAQMHTVLFAIAAYREMTAGGRALGPQ